MINTAVGLLPVLALLAVLVLMDSFKLVPLRAVLASILAGAVVALLAAFANGSLMDALSLERSAFSRYVSPISEELLKAVPVAFLLLRRRIGFLVDAAIHGFAIGAGFALVENVEYLRSLGEAGLYLWLVRGFGTALLHGATTSIMAILSKSLGDRHRSHPLLSLLPGLAAAIAVHSLFNHFILPPLLTTAVLLVALPLLLVAVFEYSERNTREWLGVGFDANMEMLRLLNSEVVSHTPIGAYLRDLRNRFDGMVVADMLCLLRLHVELSIRAKGALLAREAGLPVPPDEELRAKLRELSYLESSIGRTGLLALQPLMQTTSRDEWELHLLRHDGAAFDRGEGKRARRS